MKIRSINRAAIIVAVVLGVVAIVISYAFGLKITTAIYFGTVSCVISFIVSKLVIYKFVAFRIKPLYQLVLSKDTKTSELENEDVISGVEQQITSWVEYNRREISRLKANEKYRKEFLGNVSHEIKTPIFNIQGYVLTLLDGGIDDPSINRKYLERAEKSIERLNNIVEDLERISKLESGVLNLKREKFDVVSLAGEIAESLEMKAEKRNIKLFVGNRHNVPTPSFMVYGDKVYIGQVLTNLIDNSIKYGKDNGSTSISFIDTFDKVLVEVKDSGVGISEEDLPRIFERFYRTDKSRSREMGGTGLGLAIVKHIIEAHHEKISVRSQLGKGSTFSFTLSKTE